MNDSTKDYIINLRVSRETYDKIKAKAKENGDTISNLIRKAIDDTTEIISDLSEEVFGTREPHRDVISYHKAHTAKEMKCDQCGMEVAEGMAVTVGETRTGHRYFFCAKCRK